MGPDDLTLALLLSRSTTTSAPAIPLRALSTRPTQCIQVIPSIVKTFSLILSLLTILVGLSPLNLFSLRALVTTKIDEKLIAKAANMGFSLHPKAVKKTPAAKGIPRVL